MATPSAPPDRGLRLSYLRHFINEHGGEAEFAGKTTAQVCFEFVVPLTKPSELSLVDHVANDPMTASFVGPANWYVSHAWQYLFLETVDSLERFFADRDLSDDAVLWFCVFNNNQHLASSYPFEYWSTTFKDSLAAIGNMVMIMHPWNDPIVLRRSWCVFEVYVAVTMGARFEIALAHDQEATFLSDITIYNAFSKMLATIKCEDSVATVPSDRDGIFTLIRAETSFIAVDRLIFSTLTHWIKQTLEASIASASSSLEKASRWRYLGVIHDALNDHAASERCFQAAVTLFLAAHGPLNEETLLLQSLAAFARAYQRTPQSEWEPRLRSTLSTALQHLGETHPTTLAARSNVVSSLCHNDAHAEALPLALEDFDVRRSLYGLCDWRTMSAMSTVGLVYVSQHEAYRASRWLRKALGLQVTHLCREHNDTIGTKSRLVDALLQMGDGVQARALAESVVASRARTYGATHPRTVACRINLAASVLMTGDAALASAQMLALTTTLGADDPTRLAVQLNLGVAYAMQAQWANALASFIDAFASAPCKVTAWLLYGFAVHAPLPVSKKGLTLVRDFIISSSDAQPETWPTRCMACYTPVTGTLRPSRLMRFCQHDPKETTWKMTLPPRRYFYEADLCATETAHYDDIDGLFAAYERHCDMHNDQRTLDAFLAAMPTPMLSRALIALQDLVATPDTSLLLDWPTIVLRRAPALASTMANLRSLLPLQPSLSAVAVSGTDLVYLGPLAAMTTAMTVVFCSDQTTDLAWTHWVRDFGRRCPRLRVLEIRASVGDNLGLIQPLLDILAYPALRLLSLRGDFLLDVASIAVLHAWLERGGDRGLRLDGTQFADAADPLLYNALHTIRSFVEFRVRNVRGLSWLLPALRSASQLRTLDLSGHGSLCPNAIAALLPHWPHLQTLDLSRNRFDSYHDVVPLMSAMGQCPMLRHVVLQQCKLPQSVISPLLGCISAWPSLRRLDLACTGLYLPARAFRAMVTALVACPDFAFLSVCFPLLTDAMWRDIVPTLGAGLLRWRRITFSECQPTAVQVLQLLRRLLEHNQQAFTVTCGTISSADALQNEYTGLLHELGLLPPPRASCVVAFEVEV
ncbi:hypothetical protein SDRG_11814 [Saprolegnia diclina VS20]|uniref:Uncharacterized protein n=1 Tax=Saprolegnia diclina (strain VS20) TaxID=1156394 RepID=T0RE11_SAPDV|nr:hypothetical protein SDRG_11814 [Saprolegnia diclina VS20]EQC30498.1 hypothetical protein SDRG_11814 [Saprolegnia diclina VS20]|eukprot:XP_008616091.1 hypothetical protein SDRG_11814 [Saprolegnia diclina VS20]